MTAQKELLLTTSLLRTMAPRESISICDMRIVTEYTGKPSVSKYTDKCGGGPTSGKVGVPHENFTLYGHYEPVNAVFLIVYLALMHPQ